MTNGAGLEPGGNTGADPAAVPEVGGRVDPLAVLPPPPQASAEQEPHVNPDTTSDSGTTSGDSGDGGGDT